MSDELNDFKDFLKKREEAGNSYVNGDAEPLGHFVTKKLPATFFGPQGGCIKGADQVYDRYKNDANSFERGGSSYFEIIDIQASGDIAYWVGLQKAEAYMQGQKDAIPMSLRITEIFRKEGEEWKMVHRHADSLAEEK